MKRIIFLLLILISSLTYGQVVTTKIVKISNATLPFVDNIPAFVKIINQSNYKEYLTLQPLAGIKSLSTCILNTDIIEAGVGSYKYSNDSTGVTSGYVSLARFYSTLLTKVDKVITINGHSLSSNVVITPTDLSLVIGVNVTAYRTFGTAAANNTEDFERPLTFSTGLVRIGNVITNNITQYTNTLARTAISFIPGRGDYNSSTGLFTLPTNTNQLINGAGFISSYSETDPSVYAWAKTSVKPIYTKDEVGLDSVLNHKQWYSGFHPTTPIGYGLPDYPITLPASDVYPWAKQPLKPNYTKAEVGLSNVTNNTQWYSGNHPSTFTDYGLIDPSGVYLPLAGGIVTGTTNFAAGTLNEVDILTGKGTAGETGLTVWTLNSDSNSEYGTNILGNLGANRKILRVGESLGSNGFTVDWIHSTSKFAYLFSQGDVTVNGKYIVSGGTGSQILLANGATVDTSHFSSMVSTSGTYSPTLTNFNNTSTLSFSKAYYTKVGNIVHVMVSGTCTSTNTFPIFYITLPFASTDAGVNVPIGTGSVESNSAYATMYVAYRYTEQVAKVCWIATGTQTGNFSVQFDYVIN